MDAIQGCPAWQVPERHLARGVWRIVQQLDLSAIEGRYSPLGRHGFEPRRLLAIWVNASLIGLHHGSKLAKALETDAALRLLSGGHAVSRSKLNEFRQQHGALFADCMAQTVTMAQAQGLVPLDDLAPDSMRLRTHASTKAVLVTADTHDCGLLEPLIAETRKALARSGVSAEAKLQIGADAGYRARTDLAFAARARNAVDILVTGTEPSQGPSELFGRDRFSFAEDRIATIEPVFSNRESTMGFRRASSRHEHTVMAEVLLKALAHNVSRLLGARGLSRVHCLLTPEARLIPLKIECSATV